MKIYKFCIIAIIHCSFIFGATANEVEKVVILGSGASGSSAAIFTGQADLSPLVIQDVDCKAQMALIHKIDNYPGVLEEIEGVELLHKFRQQAKNFGARFIEDTVYEVDLVNRPFRIELASGKTIYTETIIIASGTEKRWLNLPKEMQLRGKGVMGASFCKETNFVGKTVVVTGSGHAALQEAHHLSSMADKVILVNRGDKFNASKFHQQMVFDNDKIEIIYNTEVVELVDSEKGNLSSVVLQNKLTSKRNEVSTDILLVAIGNRPNTDLFKGQLELTQEGNIIVKNTKTSIPGVFAAGDVTDAAYGRVAVASGAGAMAALEVIQFLNASQAK